MTERADIVRNSFGFETPDVHSSSVDYADRFSGSIGRWLLHAQAVNTSALLPSDCVKILDAGGGHGQNLPLLKLLQAQITILGSDISCSQLIRSELSNEKIVFSVGPLTKMPFQETDFDLTLSFRMLTHLVGWREHISELCRVARTTVLIEFPVRKGFNIFSSQFFGLKKNIEINTRPFTLFNENDIISEFNRHGFVLTSRRPQFFWPIVLHRMHKCPGVAGVLEWLPRLTGFTRIFGSPIIARFDRKVD